jgi:dTDP-4-dehydrorhamnose 3,5-epimerase
MQFLPTRIPDVVLIEPAVYHDQRGFFMETFHDGRFDAAGLNLDIRQDNHSRSHRGVLRGLHYQRENPQGKLVRVTRGAIFDVAVDLRRSSSTFGQWTGVILDDQRHQQLWVPPGFAHGFLVLSDVADVIYRCTALYAPGDEHTLLWNDPDVGIDWPTVDSNQPLLSAKDEQGVRLADAVVYD